MSPNCKISSSIDCDHDEHFEDLSHGISPISSVQCSNTEQMFEKRDRSVRFGPVVIREYIRIVGDHPDVKVGPPISIGWEYCERESLPLDEYEANRPPKRTILRMTSITRKNMLRNVFDVPEEEIRSAEKEIQKIQRQRDHSKKQNVMVAKVEDAIKTKSRKIRQRFSKDVLFRSFAATAQSISPVYIHM